MKYIKTAILFVALSTSIALDGRSISGPTYEFIDHIDNKIIARRSDGITYLLTYIPATRAFRGIKYLNKKINPALKGPEYQPLSAQQAEVLWHELLALLEIS
jgi:hypothetical protein